ncbi:Site-specific recombinase XerD [Pseudomonas amygdali pv. lachrymans]|nr:Site-specific recombinase XerD [Pseudomonas amygdali pv. lachrymans]RMV51148.1 Site-specific recombinase, phage integrase [Pseudomonas amygdali pv. lachrymans]
MVGPLATTLCALNCPIERHLYTAAIQEWGLGLTFNPVLNIRKPSPRDGGDRRLSPEEERLLLAAVNRHSNPMLGWIVCIALETGMRSSEISSLRRPQVDLAKRVIRLSDTKNNGSRTVPFSKRASCLIDLSCHPTAS